MRFILPLILLFPLWAGAAEYWVDLDGTVNGTGDCSSYTNACAAFGDADLTAGAGDTIYLCNARTPGDSGFSFTKDGSDGDPLIVDGNCVGDDVPGNASVSLASDATPMTVNGAQYVTFQNISFARDGGGTCINYNPAGASPDNTYDNVTFENCTFGITTAGTDVDGFTVKNSTFRNIAGTALLMNLPASLVDTVTIEDNEFANNQGTAVTIQPLSGNEADADVDNVTISGNSITRNYGGVQVFLGDVTNKSHPCVDSGPLADNVQIIDNTLIDNYNTADLSGGSAAVGGGCWENSLIARNYISRISTTGAVIQHSAGVDTVIEDNTIVGPVYPSNDTDGCGIFVDQRTIRTIVRRNFIKDIPYPENLAADSNSCSGYGIALYRATDPRIYSNIIYNTYAGLRVNGFDNGDADTETQGAIVAGNVFATIENDVFLLRSNVDRADSISAYNNVGINAGGAFFNLEDTATEQTNVSHNAYFNTGEGFINQTSGGSDITTDPMFVGGPNPTTAEGFKLQTDSPLIRAGTCYLTTGCAHYDYEGKRARVPPDIGAFQRNDP